MKYHSVLKSTTQALYQIQELYLSGMPIHLDPMFNIGSMYAPGNGVPIPKMLFDKHPSSTRVLKGDARNLPLHDRSVRSMVLDPPWLITNGTLNRMALRYGHFSSKSELCQFIEAITKEAYRILDDNAILICKCQDFTHDRRKFFMSLYWTNYAISTGFNPLDELIIVPPSRMRSPVHPEATRHTSESQHSKVLVFRKKRTRQSYIVNRKAELTGIHPDGIGLSYRPVPHRFE